MGFSVQWTLVTSAVRCHPVTLVGKITEQELVSERQREREEGMCVIVTVTTENSFSLWKLQKTHNR